MKSFSFNLPFKPKAKGRPRAGKYSMYTDKATREYEQAVKDAYVLAKGPKFDGPICLSMVFNKDNMVITIKEIRAESSLRGDLDNYIKSIMDGLNGAAYEDDKCVLDIKAFKR